MQLMQLMQLMQQHPAELLHQLPLRISRTFIELDPWIQAFKEPETI
jgi:hypothetical protein